MTKEEFIAKAQKIHGDKYDYSLVPSVVRTIDNVNIICPIHCVFKQNARTHYRHSGCPKCTNEERGRKYRMSIEEFIITSQEDPFQKRSVGGDESRDCFRFCTFCSQVVYKFI